MIHLIVDQNMWPPDECDPIQPPNLRRLPGRPTKNRRREAGEATLGTSDAKRNLTVHCCICGNLGHNKRSCQRAPVRGKRTAGTSSNMVNTCLCCVYHKICFNISLPCITLFALLCVYIISEEEDQVLHHQQEEEGLVLHNQQEEVGLVEVGLVLHNQQEEKDLVLHNQLEEVGLHNQLEEVAE